MEDMAMRIQETVSGFTPEEARRMVMHGPTAVHAAWERIQRARCAADRPHAQRLVIPRRGGTNEPVLVDIGSCRHNP